MAPIIGERGDAPSDICRLRKVIVYVVLESDNAAYRIGHLDNVIAYVVSEIQTPAHSIRDLYKVSGAVVGQRNHVGIFIPDACESPTSRERELRLIFSSKDKRAISIFQDR